MGASKLIYITGGARSGKSRYAVDLARRLAKRVVFVATAYPTDDEVKQRIQFHRKERPQHWTTIEKRLDIWKIFSELKGRTDLVLIDCLTMYVSNRLVAGEKDAQISEHIEKICEAAKASKMQTILVSNEVGSGVVPATVWGRQIQDYLGRANQIMAQHAETVIFMVSGLPMVIKGRKR